MKLWKMAAAAAAMVLAVGPAQAATFNLGSADVGGGSLPSYLTGINAPSYTLTITFDAVSLNGADQTVSIGGSYDYYLTDYRSCGISPSYPCRIVRANTGTSFIATTTLQSFTESFTVINTYGSNSISTNVDFRIASNNPGDIVRLTNLRFSNVSSVTSLPEPVTWALTLAGFGMIGTTLRTRRRAAVVQASV